MSESPRNGGDVLVDVMDALGVDVAFGVVSIHNLPLVDAVASRRRFVPVRHEAAAVNAADAYGRVRGTVGVAITSTGTGAGNAAGAMVEALSAGAAVLHVTGQVELEHLGRRRGYIHETKDQAGMLRAVGKAVHTIVDAHDAGTTLARAAAQALEAPMGPVSVEWPIDLQYRRQRPPVPRPAVVVPARPTPDPAEIARAAELIAAARRPLVWAGGGATGAREEIAALLERTGAGLLTSNAGRGTIAEDEVACIGNFAANPECAELLGEADLLVSVGTHFRSNETRDYSLELPHPHVQIDINAEALGSSYPVDVGLVGDASTVLRALLASLPARGEARDGWLRSIVATRRRVRQHLSEGIGAQASICDTLRGVLPRDAVIARDVTIPSSSWGNRMLTMFDPTTNVFPRGGGIGQGLAMGIGASIARPERPTAVMVGDGGLAVHLGELLTLAQERPWVVVVVFNDGGYGVLRNAQDAFVGRRSGVDLFTPSFAKLAEAVGLPYRHVVDVDAFEVAFAEAVAEHGPVLVEVDVEAIGPMPRPFTPPVAVG